MKKSAPHRIWHGLDLGSCVCRREKAPRVTARCATTVLPGRAAHSPPVSNELQENPEALPEIDEKFIRGPQGLRTGTQLGKARGLLQERKRS